MGVDYVVDLGCEPKDVLGTQEIVDLLKARSRAEYVRDMMRSQGDVRSLSEMTFETVVLRPEGPIREEVSVQALFDDAKALDPLASACEGCEARCTPRPFGCVGYVSYPVSAATEAWLLEQLPDRLDSSAGTMLESAVWDFDWDGSYTRHLRAQGDTFFENRASPRRTWGEVFQITGDQIWQILFGLGHLSPAHSMMCALFVGLIPHEIAADALGGLSQDTALVAGHALRYDIDHPDLQIAELRRFFRAMGLAAAMNTTVLIDG